MLWNSTVIANHISQSPQMSDVAPVSIIVRSRVKWRLKLITAAELMNHISQFHSWQHITTRAAVPICEAICTSWELRATKSLNYYYYQLYHTGTTAALRVHVQPCTTVDFTTPAPLQNSKVSTACTEHSATQYILCRTPHNAVQHVLGTAQLSTACTEWVFYPLPYACRIRPFVGRSEAISVRLLAPHWEVCVLVCVCSSSNCCICWSLFAVYYCSIYNQHTGTHIIITL